MIATFYPPYNFGGDGIYAQRLADELARRGHQVEVIHDADAYRLLAGREPEPGPPEHPNITVHRLSSPFGLLSPLATQQTGRPLFHARRIQEILARGFDVIHYHNISLVGGPKILEYGRGLKLYTLHEYWLVCPTHTLFRYNRAPCTQPHCLTCTLTYRRPPQWWRYTNLLPEAAKHVDAFLAPTPFVRDAHHARGFAGPIVHLPYFVPESAPPDEASTPPGPGRERQPYFLFVGRLEKIKGLHTLIPVMRRYPQARLLIAGSGSEEARLRRLAGGDPRIEFLGRLSARQLQPLYRQAAALVVPSLVYETTAFVIFEAFQQQTPVIARKLGGMAGVVSDSGGGFTYNGDEDLVRALDQILADPIGRDAMGRRGYQTYTERWSPAAHMQAYFQLIGQLAGGRASRQIS